jgi:hypothetical protein
MLLGFSWNGRCDMHYKRHDRNHEPDYRSGQKVNGNILVLLHVGPSTPLKTFMKFSRKLRCMDLLALLPFNE